MQSSCNVKKSWFCLELVSLSDGKFVYSVCCKVLTKCLLPVWCWTSVQWILSYYSVRISISCDSVFQCLYIVCQCCLWVFMIIITIKVFRVCVKHLKKTTKSDVHFSWDLGRTLSYLSVISAASCFSLVSAASTFSWYQQCVVSFLFFTKLLTSSDDMLVSKRYICVKAIPSLQTSLINVGGKERFYQSTQHRDLTLQLDMFTWLQQQYEFDHCCYCCAA